MPLARCAAAAAGTAEDHICDWCCGNDVFVVLRATGVYGNLANGLMFGFQVSRGSGSIFPADADRDFFPQRGQVSAVVASTY